MSDKEEAINLLSSSDDDSEVQVIAVKKSTSASAAVATSTAAASKRQRVARSVQKEETVIHDASNDNEDVNEGKNDKGASDDDDKNIFAAYVAMRNKKRTSKNLPSQQQSKAHHRRPPTSATFSSGERSEDPGLDRDDKRRPPTKHTKISATVDTVYAGKFEVNDTVDKSKDGANAKGKQSSLSSIRKTPTVESTNSRDASHGALENIKNNIDSISETITAATTVKLTATAHKDDVNKKKKEENYDYCTDDSDATQDLLSSDEDEDFSSQRSEAATATRQNDAANNHNHQVNAKRKSFPSRPFNLNEPKISKDTTHKRRRQNEIVAERKIEENDTIIQELGEYQETALQVGEDEDSDDAKDDVYSKLQRFKDRHKRKLAKPKKIRDETEAFLSAIEERPFSVGGSCDTIMGLPGLQIRDVGDEYIAFPLSQTQTDKLMRGDSIVSNIKKIATGDAMAALPSTMCKDAVIKHSSKATIKIADDSLAPSLQSAVWLAAKMQDAPYTVGQDVLAKDKHRVYRACIQKVDYDEDRGEYFFHVHYEGWKARFDKWLTQNDLMKDTNLNRKNHLQEDKLRHENSGNRNQYPPLEDARTKDELLSVGDAVYAPYPGDDPGDDGHYWGRITRIYEARACRYKLLRGKIGSKSRSSQIKVYDIKFHDGDKFKGMSSDPLMRLPEVLYLMGCAWLDRDDPPEEYLLDIHANEDRIAAMQVEPTSCAPAATKAMKQKGGFDMTHPMQRPQRSDTDIKRWMPDQVSFRNPKHPSMLNALMRLVCSKANIDRTMIKVGKLEKVLLQIPGNNPERLVKVSTSSSSEEMAGSKSVVGTLLIVLPSVYTGGCVEVLDVNKTSPMPLKAREPESVRRPVVIDSYDFSSFNSHECAYAFACCATIQFGLKTLLSGSRLILVYQVLRTDTSI